MVCRVCLKQSELELPIFDESGVEQRIPDILQLHLWFTPSPNDPISKVICLSCWYKLLEFNQFYENAKEAHKFYSAQHEILVAAGTIPDLSHPVEVVEAAFNVKHEDTVDEKWLISVEDEEMPSHTNDNINPLYEPEPLESITVKTEKLEDNEEISDNSEDGSDDGDFVGDTDSHSEYEPAATEIKRAKNSKTSNVNMPKISKRAREAAVKTKTTPSKAAKVPKKQTSQCKTEKRCWSAPKDDEMVRKYLPLNCELCCFHVENYTEMIKHFKDSHKNVRPYVVCCGRRFSNRQRVVQHAYKHEDPNYFQCQICKKNFSNHYVLSTHMRDHHSDEDKLVHQCDQCEKRFSRRYLLKLHKAVHIPVEDREFMCTKCPTAKAFASDHLLNIHDSICHKYAANVCHVCAKSIRDNRAFERHVRLHFEESGPRVKCPHQGCDKYLKDEKNLKVHLRRHEQVTQNYSCDQCEKIVKSALALRSHKKYAHTTEKFSCNLCSKTFKRRISLKEHLASHLGEPLYKCPFCSRTFNSNANMHSHKKKQHPDEWENWRKTKTQSAQTTLK